MNSGFFMFRLICSFFCLSLFGVANAQTYIVQCDLSGVIPDMNNLQLKERPVTMESHVIGHNIFFNINEPKIFAMTVNSIETVENVGTNLSSMDILGARTKNKKTGRESQITLDRKTVEFNGYHDVVFHQKMVRIFIHGSCQTPVAN